jgi:hypothetical protein
MLSKKVIFTLGLIILGTDPVPELLSHLGFNKQTVRNINLYLPGISSEKVEKVSDINYFCTRKSCNYYHADMDGNAWDGYLWVDGWPVTPPRTQQPPPDQLPHPQTHPQPQPQPQPVPQPVPAPPPPMQPPSHQQPALPVHPSLDSAIQVNTAQVESKAEDCDQNSNYTGTSYDPSQLSDSDEEEDVVDDNTIKLGNSYSQCRAAREAAMAADVTDISCNSNALSTEKKKGFRVGAMDKNLGNEVMDCFKGARIEQNGNLVNQFLSSSFDPSTLTCITCSSEHSIWGGGGWI